MTINKTYRFIFALIIFIVANITVIKIITTVNFNEEIVSVEYDENEPNETEDEINDEEFALIQMQLQIPVFCMQVRNGFVDVSSSYSFPFKEKILNPPKF